MGGGLLKVLVDFCFKGQCTGKDSSIKFIDSKDERNGTYRVLLCRRLQADGWCFGWRCQGLFQATGASTAADDGGDGTGLTADDIICVHLHLY